MLHMPFITAKFLLPWSLTTLLTPVPGDADSSRIDVSLREGTNMAVALSPDNKTLALDLQGTIWVMSSTGGKAVPVTDDLGDCHEPAWSPDGNHIAFHSYRDGNYNIWAVRKDGSGLRRITSGIFDDREPCWSPDGTRIIFSSDRNSNYDIWETDLNTGELMQLTGDPANEYNPAFSPDGKRIAYVSDGREAGIYILDKDVKSLLYPSSLRLAAPSWSRNGNRLLFTEYERSKTTLLLTDIKERTTKKISDDEDIFPFRASWSDNDTFFYTADGKIKKRTRGKATVESVPFEAVISLNRKTYRRKQYNFDDRSEQKALGITGPVVSPDGKHVAFSALNDIYIQTIAGPVTRVTSDFYADIDPDWSPDGRAVAYVSDRNGSMQVWVQDLETGRSMLLTNIQEGSASMPVWSPDGRKIAYYVKGVLNEWGQADLCVADMLTGESVTVLEKIFVPGRPCWTGNGTTIGLMALKPASSRFREGKNEFLMVNLNDKTKYFTSTGSSEYPGIRGQNGPVWSPDGTMIAYIRDGFLCIDKVDEMGNIRGEPIQYTCELADKISWSGDSKSIVYLAVDKLKKLNIETDKSEIVTVNIYWRPQMPDEQYIIHAGKLFNGIDSNYIYNVDILIDGHRIKSIRPHSGQSELPVIDASGKTVMPGLFESHTHLHSVTGEKLGRIFLSNGITSVREAGADPYDALERKESWASDASHGPRLFSTGFFDGGRVYYGLSNPIVSEKHMLLELERAGKLGFDLIKTYVRLDDSFQKEIIEAAHKAGIPASSHEIYPAARYNIDAVEHFRGTSRRGYSPKQSALNRIYDDVIRIYVKSGIVVTPTIVMHEGFLKMTKEDPALLENKQLNAFYSENYIRSWANRKAPDDYGPNFHEFQKAVCAVVNSGGNITAGTDSPFVPYGTSLHAELWLFTDGGLTPFQALQTATIKAAEAAGAKKDLGSVEPGKLADLVIINGDPLDDIKNTRNVEIVIKNGIRYNIDDLLSF